MKTPGAWSGLFFIPFLTVAGGLNAQSDPGAGRVGTSARVFSLKGLWGETVEFPPDLSGRKGLSILVFWSTWNRFSEMELNRLSTFWRNWSARGVRVVAVSVEASRIGELEIGRVREFVSKKKIPFPVALDDGLEAFRAYGVIAVPTTIVVDKDGKIAMRLAGFPIGGEERLVTLVERRLRAEEETAADSTEFVALRHNRAVRYVRLARVLREKGQLELAIYTLERAIKEDKNLVGAHIELFKLHRFMKKPKKAISSLEEALRRFPGNAPLLVEKARLVLENQEKGKAREIAKEALEKNPAFAPCLTLLGRIALEEGKTGVAIERFLKAIDLNPLDPEPVLQAAIAHERRGDKVEAVKRYEQVYDLLNSR